MKYILPIVVILIVSYACTPTEISEELSPMTPPPTTFGNLNEGDQLQYRFFYGHSYYSDETERCYTNDTLIIEVTEVISADEIVVKEYLSPNSEIFEVLPDSNYMWNNPNEELSFKWSLYSMSLEIENHNSTSTRISSKLNYFNKTYPTSNDMNDVVTFTKWKPSPLEGNYCEEVEILGRTYDNLFLHVDNGPTVVDGNGASYLYNNEHAFVRTFTNSAWTGAVQGWDLIDQ